MKLKTCERSKKEESRMKEGEKKEKKEKKS
jgi:hypothetical protein